jgi:integrase
MATILPRTEDGKYVVRWYWTEGKKRVQKQKTFTGPTAQKDAHKFLADVETKMQQKKKESVMDSIPTEVKYFDQLAALYFLADALKEQKSWKLDWKNLLNRHLLEELGQIPMDQLNEQFITALVIQKFPNASPITHGNYLAYLKMMFNFGIQREYIEKNPLRFFRKPTSPQKELLLDLKTIQKIKDAAPDHLAFAIELLSSTGLRPGPSELLSLRYDNIQWDQNSLRVFAGKTGKWRSIPLKPALLSKLKARMKTSESGFIIEYKGKPVKSIHRSFRRTCEKLNIDKSVVLYDIRHWFCTQLLSKGASVKACSQLAGHSSAKMTLDVYSHTIQGDTNKAIELLPDLN